MKSMEGRVDSRNGMVDGFHRIGSFMELYFCLHNSVNTAIFFSDV
jgi:hypothetical protein